MPPSPGKIHQLPVKVLYSIDTSSQSYLTVLHDRQDVYIHPASPSYGSSEGEGPVGSCTLKVVARGICYASPECIPNTTSLDFSVYNLDPAIRRPPPSASARAFPSSPSDHPTSSPSSWIGKGFLSWVLSENGGGSTLIKGRLVREYEFSSIHFAPEGGLEGLMALANSNSGGSSTDNEGADGKGWGLEVSISLKQLNPDGKIEFQNRKEFEEMLSKGKSTSISTSSPVRGSNTIGGGNTPARSSPLINSTTNRTPNVNSTPSHPGPSASSTATVRPTVPIAQPTPVPLQQQQQQQSRPSSSLSHRASSSSMPPSSLPALPSSSASNLPSSRPSSSIGESRPPPPQQHQSSASIPTRQNTSSNQSEAGPSTMPQRNRQVTPPPIPRSKSPPPSTPSRGKLHALLRADGMMSPELARHLASNPVLRNLLKAVPSNSNALTALRNITGINRSPTSNATANAGKKPTEDKEDSPEATTPTPLPTPQRITRSAQSNGNDGCCNCGTLISSCWRVKKMKDGTPRKVCDDCGLYFNEHKKMRPPELWSQPFKPGSSSTSSAQQHQNGAGEKRKHAIELNDGPASGLRSSPRLNRTNSDQITHTQSSSAHGTLPESPRKRQKTKTHGNPPPPSPRRSTRNSSKNEGNIDFGAEVFGFSPSTSTSGGNSVFGTSPAIPITTSGQDPMQSFGQSMSQSNTNGTDHGNGNMEEMDISAFLATFENSLTQTHHQPGTNGTNTAADGLHGNNDGFNFDALFNGDSGMGIELSQEMQDLLNGWESQLNDPNYLQGLDIPGLGNDEHAAGGGGTS
ncbi:hypothetical protein I302_103259 [Kwoniella bestiolae CBS 10118]|uniref:GATA-type domain-containing protein n=1 Tax=Kwoniella bestiolae CBS 10118 TaxID=1296100 RepID=A0A1B9G7Z3_9TREE|nr:hypothetical protein I302_01958 [Kwoniella bestiolae CBS 10118]OCF27123.1 hypothetical protein I302_01958 [Kwoniella bestiolae CBS 10118]